MAFTGRDVISIDNPASDKAARLSAQLFLRAGGYILNAGCMPNLRYLRRRIKAADAGVSADLAIFGDSWTFDKDRYFTLLAQALVDDMGDAGGGWIGFSYSNKGTSYRNNSWRPADFYVASSAGWSGSDSNYFAKGSPDSGQIQTSATSGAVVDVRAGAGQTSCKLMAVINPSGSIRYRWDGGSWTTLALTSANAIAGQGQGSSTGIWAAFNLAGVPSTAHQLEIENTAGTNSLSGVFYAKSGLGIRVHKMGCDGSRLAQWAGASVNSRTNSLKAGGFSAMGYMLGLNDRRFATTVTPADYAAKLNQLLDTDLAALPAADQFLIMQPEVGITTKADGSPLSYTGAEFSEAALEVGASRNIPVILLQPSFGRAYSEYGPSGPRPLINADDLHPDTATGSRAIAETLQRFLLAA